MELEMDLIMLGNNGALSDEEYLILNDGYDPKLKNKDAILNG